MAVLTLTSTTAGCTRVTLDEPKAAAVLRSHARFSDPIVIGLALGRTADDAGATAAAVRVLENRGVLDPGPKPPATMTLTEAGGARLGSDGWALLEAPAGRTLVVPVARRELIAITTVRPDDGGGRIGFDWRWVVTDVGQALRAGGVDLHAWGLRIDDAHTFQGGARLAFSGETWAVNIIRPPD